MFDSLLELQKVCHVGFHILQFRLTGRESVDILSVFDASTDAKWAVMKLNRVNSDLCVRVVRKKITQFGMKPLLL